MKKILLKSIVLVAMLLSSGCLDDNMEKRMDELAPATIKIGSEFYSYLQTGNYEKLSSLFSNNLYTTYERKHIDTLFSDIRRKHGTVKTYDFLGTKFTTSAKDGQTEHYISNEYKVFYSTGYLSKERLTFVVEKNTTAISKIDGYTFYKYGSQE